MKKILLLLLILLLPAVSFAEGWKTPVLNAPYEYSYQDERRSIVINRVERDGASCLVADVQIADASGFMAVSIGDSCISDEAGKAGAVLAFNSDNYGVHDYGIIIRDGQLIRANDTTRHMLALLPDGSLHTISDRKIEKPKTVAQKLLDMGVIHTFEFGPVLVLGGQAVGFPQSFDLISTRSSRLEPRTAIGMIEPLHYLVIVADGRQPGYSDGLSLQSLQQMFVDYGVQTALNLDGGGSAEMWFQGEVISQPSGGHERRLTDMICF